MEIKTYPSFISEKHDGSYTAEEVRRGYVGLHTDIACPWCGKLQPLAATQYVGGPCCCCGKLTSGIREAE